MPQFIVPLQNRFLKWIQILSNIVTEKNHQIFYFFGGQNHFIRGTSESVDPQSTLLKLESKSDVTTSVSIFFFSFWVNFMWHGHLRHNSVPRHTANFVRTGKLLLPKIFPFLTVLGIGDYKDKKQRVLRKNNKNRNYFLNFLQFLWAYILGITFVSFNIIS